MDFPGKAKSSVWRYFGFIKEKKENGPSVVLKEKAYCKICKQGYKYTGGTTDLMAHIDLQHGISLKGGIKTKDFPAAQPKTTAAYSSGNVKGPIPPARKAQIDEKLNEFIIKDLRPVSMVEGDGFRDMLKALESRYMSLRPNPNLQFSFPHDLVYNFICLNLLS